MSDIEDSVDFELRAHDDILKMRQDAGKGTLLSGYGMGMHGILLNVLSADMIDKLQQLFVLAGPLTATAVIQQAANVSNFIFLGHMPVQPGDPYTVATCMGAATLGNMMCNVTGYTLTYGMTAALDTLLSQAYGGKKFRLLGIHTQKSIIILSLLSFLVSFIWIHTEEILLYGLSIDAETALLAGQWSKVLVYSLWPTVMFEILKRFMQNQKILWPIVTATVLGTVINIIANYLFIFRWRWGFLGAAYTMVVMQWSVLFLMVSLMLVRRWYVLRVARPQTASLGPYTAVARDDAAEDIELAGSSLMVAEDETLNLNLNLTAASAASGVVVDSSLDSMASEDSEYNWPTIVLFPPATAPTSDKAGVVVVDTRSAEYNSVYVGELFNNWGEFMALGLPSAASMFIEWWVTLVLAWMRRLGKCNQSAHSIYTYIYICMYLL